jgi:hypothetical protein
MVLGVGDLLVIVTGDASARDREAYARAIDPDKLNALLKLFVRVGPN